jgi:hypothetical protein
MAHQPPVQMVEDWSDEYSTTEISEKEASSSSSVTPIGQHETKAVNRSKSLVYLVLLIAAAAAGTATYFFLSIKEQEDFESEVRINVFLRSSCGSARRYYDLLSSLIYVAVQKFCKGHH